MSTLKRKKILPKESEFRVPFDVDPFYSRKTNLAVASPEIVSVPVKYREILLKMTPVSVDEPKVIDCRMFLIINTRLYPVVGNLFKELIRRINLA